MSKQLNGLCPNHFHKCKQYCYKCDLFRCDKCEDLVHGFAFTLAYPFIKKYFNALLLSPTSPVCKKIRNSKEKLRSNFEAEKEKLKTEFEEALKELSSITLSSTEHDDILKQMNEKQVGIDALNSLKQIAESNYEKQTQLLEKKSEYMVTKMESTIRKMNSLKEEFTIIRLKNMKSKKIGPEKELKLCNNKAMPLSQGRLIIKNYS